MADPAPTLAPQGVNSPNYNAAAPLGSAGSLDPSISVPNPNAGGSTVASSSSSLASAGNSGLTATAVSSPAIPSKATAPEINAFLGTNGFTDKQLTQYGITQNADGSYNVPQGALNVRSQQLNQNAITSTSSSVQTQENATTGTVSNLVQGSQPITLPDGSTVNASSADAQALKTLDDYTTSLEARRAAEAASINADYDAQQTGLEGKQANETGSETATIARIGGYLGGSASGTGAMLNLAATHKTELLTLQSSRQAALQAASNAIDDKEFAVAQAKVAEIKSIDDTIYQRQQDFFKNALALQQANTANTTAQQNIIDNTLKDLSTTPAANVPQATKDSIDSFYGVPGFADSYIKAANSAASAKAQSDQTKANSDLLDMLQKIPQGQKVTMPDGTQYTGLGAAGDIATFMQVDNNGIGHLVTYNKRTGATTAQTVGAVGKGASGSSAGGVAGVPPVVVDNAKAIISSALEAGKDPKTNQYNPDDYLNLREELKAKQPALLSYMDSVFLNPSNKFFSDTAIARLRAKGVTYTGLPAAGLDTAAPAADPTQEDNAQ